MKIEKGKKFRSKTFSDCELIVMSDLDESKTYKCLLKHSENFIEETYLPHFYINKNYVEITNS